MQRERIKEPLIKGSFVTQFTLKPDAQDVERDAEVQAEELQASNLD